MYKNMFYLLYVEIMSMFIAAVHVCVPSPGDSFQGYRGCYILVSETGFGLGGSSRYGFRLVESRVGIEYVLANAVVLVSFIDLRDV